MDINWMNNEALTRADINFMASDERPRWYKDGFSRLKASFSGVWNNALVTVISIHVLWAQLVN
jgi:hypothetical protein